MAEHLILVGKSIWNIDWLSGGLTQKGRRSDDTLSDPEQLRNVFISLHKF